MIGNLFHRSLMGAAPPVVINLDNYLCIRPTINVVIVKFEQDLQYLLVDGDADTVVNPQWSTLSAGIAQAVVPPTKIVFKANLTTLSDTEGVGQFVITGNADDARCVLQGNCLSLLYGDDAAEYDTIPSRAFLSLFEDCIPIAAANGYILGNTHANNRCYERAFAGCINMVTGPYLAPSASLMSHYRMFYGCSSLIATYGSFANKVLPYSYAQMYMGCTSLNMRPRLPANGTDAERCYYQMFLGCSALNYLSVGLTSVDLERAYEMLDGVAPSGEIYTVNDPNIKEALTPAGWTWHEYQ